MTLFLYRNGLKPLLTAVLVCSLVALVYTKPSSAQERKYIRKSVSLAGTVLFKSPVDASMQAIVANRLKANLEVPRFDYNAISQEAAAGFLSKVSLTTYSADNVRVALEQTLVPQIAAAVDTLAAGRAKANLTEEALARAAVDKLKGSGLTLADISKVANAAYLYSPVVTEVIEKTESGNLNVTIKGYILWYRIDRTGSSAKLVLAGGTPDVVEGTSSAKPQDSYQIRNRKVNGTDYARLVAANTWAKNLAVQMKTIPDFQLSAEIVNVDGGTAYAGIGSREGISVDDGFDAVEQIEDGGKTKTVTTGFFRVSKVEGNPNQPSAFMGHIVPDDARGAVLLERPRLGLDFFVRPKFSKLTIPKDVTVPASLLTSFSGSTLLYSYDPILSEDATAAFGLDAGFRLNLAKFTGVSQLFLNIEGGLAYPNATLNSSSYRNYTIAPLLVDVYGGFVKKFWVRRVALVLGVSGGVDFFRLTNTTASTGDLESISFTGIGIKGDAGVELMITPDVLLSLNAGYKASLNTNTISVSIKDGDTKSFDGTGYPGIDRLKFGGLSFSVGVSYSLPSFSHDVFSPLTSMQIDY